MSYCNAAGEQVPADEVQAVSDDAWLIARAVVHDESLSTEQRRRLMWQVLDAAYRPEQAL